MTAVTTNALNLIGLALKGGRLEIGDEPVGVACRGRGVKVVLLASDAAENTVRRAERFAQTGKAPCVTLPFTKAELGHATGRVSCAVLALTDVGLAASLLTKLAGLDPERYGQSAQSLSREADLAHRRQKEQRANERNIQHKRYQPWAAPPPGKGGFSAPGSPKRQ